MSISEYNNLFSIDFREKRFLIAPVYKKFYN